MLIELRVYASVSRFWENEIPLDVAVNDQFARLTLVQCTFVRMIWGYNKGTPISFYILILLIFYFGFLILFCNIFSLFYKIHNVWCYRVKLLYLISIVGDIDVLISCAVVRLVDLGM